MVFASKKEFESKADWVSAMIMIIMKSVVVVVVGTRRDRVWYRRCSFESRRSSSLHVQHPNVWWLAWRMIMMMMIMAAIVLGTATLLVLVVVVVIHSRDDDDDDDATAAVAVVVVDVSNSPRRLVEEEVGKC